MIHPGERGGRREDSSLEKLLEPLAELFYSVTPANAGIRNLARNLDSGFHRNDARGLLQEALLIKLHEFAR